MGGRVSGEPGAKETTPDAGAARTARAGEDAEVRPVKGDTGSDAKDGSAAVNTSPTATSKEAPTKGAEDDAEEAAGDAAAKAEGAKVEAKAAATPAPAKAEPKIASLGAGPIRLRVFGRTDVGQIRDHNEDNFVVADLSLGSRDILDPSHAQLVGDRGVLLGVCDGMGGAAAGEVASQLAVDMIFQRMMAGEPPADRNDLAARLVAAIEAAGARIFAEAKADRTRRGMGTTSTAAALLDDHLFLGQVGDSRGYLLRGEKLVQVTRDQSLANQLIEAGQLTEEEAETFEHSNIILQALGTTDSVQVDLTYVQVKRGDVLMLCSDGLSGMMRNEEIREVLRAYTDPAEACRELTDRANQAGGHDNITVVVAKFEGEGIAPPTPEEVEGLRYRKYELPESAIASLRPADAPRRGGDPGRITSRVSRNPDIEVGEEEEFDDEAFDDSPLTDPVDLPREQAPSWVVTMMIVSAVTCVLVAGYYLLR
jgi:serine/threonine protein phosphatase PrpC